MKPPLHIVAPDEPAPETVSQTVRRLQAEAKALARDHVNTLIAQMAAAEATAAEIAEGGEAYPAGIREAAARLVEDISARARTLHAISARTL